MNILQKTYMEFRTARHVILKGLPRNFYIENYLWQCVRTGKKAKLHIACGERKFSNWLNADLYDGDIYMDATQRFPFNTADIDRIYSHHFIEHITFSKLIKHLSECHRVLRPGGRIRIVTPCLQKMVCYYLKADPALIKHYAKTMQSPAAFLNDEMRMHGEHIFIYDFEMLEKILKHIGFKDIREFNYSHSFDPEFKKLDKSHGYKQISRISLCIEATK